MKSILLILEGKAKGVRYEATKESIFPCFFQKGDFIGFNIVIMDCHTDWELVAISEKVKVILLNTEFIEKYIYTNFTLYKFILEKILILFG